jgi:ATP-dependent DNA helicase RecG
MADLDPRAVEDFRLRWTRKSGNTVLSKLPTQQLLEDAEAVVDGGITYAALILFGEARALGRYLPQCEVILEYRSSEAAGPAQERVEFRRAFYSYYEDLWDFVNRRNDMQHFQDGLFAWDIPTFDGRSIREATLNAIAHRDYRFGGSVFIRQFPRRIVVESPGGFPLGSTVENVLDRQSPRNRRIADLFAKCGLVERSGQGMNLMFEEAIKQGKQPPDFSGTDSYQVMLSLDGQIRDPALIRFLEMTIKETGISFSTQDLLILDAIHRESGLRESWKKRLGRLVESGVVERVSRGRGARYVLSKRL